MTNTFVDKKPRRAPKSPSKPGPGPKPVAAVAAPARAPRGARRQSIADRVASEVERLIEMRVFQPGDRIREVEIAERFNVSRGPVREAFRILQARSLLRIEPMRGATVARLSDTESRDAVEISGVLFGLAARRLAGKVSPDLKMDLKFDLAALAAMVGDDTPPKTFFEQTLKIGRHIVQSAGSVRLMMMIREVRAGALDLYGPLGFITRQLRETAIAKWTRMVEALVSGDKDTADRMAREVHEDVVNAASKLVG